MKSNNTRTIVICAALILVAALSRILSAEMTWYHFTPLVAISLFGGALLQNKSYSYLLPLSAYLLSDIYLQIAHGTGFYGVDQFFVYGGIALVAVLGTLMKRISALSVLGYTLGGTLIFWIVSNLGIYVAGYNGYDFQGFLATYIKALPFYNHEGDMMLLNAVVGDLIFSGALFGAYAILKSRQLAQNKAIA